jgi:hypothetical protein
MEDVVERRPLRSTDGCKKANKLLNKRVFVLGDLSPLSFPRFSSRFFPLFPAFFLYNSRALQWYMSPRTGSKARKQQGRIYNTSLSPNNADVATYGDVINIGSPAADSPPEGVQIVQFHNYKQLPTKMYEGSEYITSHEYITSDIFSCVGHQWSFRLYPMGLYLRVFRPLLMF